MKNLIISLVILAVAVLGTIAMVANRPAPASVSAVEMEVPVEVHRISSHDVVFTVSSQGTVQPRTETVLVAEVSGMVTYVSDKLYVGGFFQAGEVLLSLDTADYEVALNQARANLLSAQAQLAQEAAQAEQRLKEWDLSGRPRSEAPALALRTPFLKEAEARVLSAESDLQRAERQFARTSIKAPYDGLVRDKMADIGQFVGVGTQIVRIFATDYAEVRLPLSDNDLVWLNLPRPGMSSGAHKPGSDAPHAVSGETTSVTFNARSGGETHQWRGQIVRTEGVVDSSSRMHFAVARIQDPYGLRNPQNTPPLAMGTFVNATLSGVRASNIFTLPHSSIRDGNQVLVMDAEQRLRQREVNIVRADTEWVYIDRGLQNNDDIIVSPIQIPIDGMKVNPIARAQVL